MSTTKNEPLDFIFGRRSIRVYSPGEVSEPVVTKLLEAAMAAPSAMTKDPWRFVLVKDKQTLSKLATLHPGAAMLSSAALAIVVCGDLDVAFDRQLSYLLQDCSAATENLLLAAHAQGLGACWVGIHPGEPLIKRVKEGGPVAYRRLSPKRGTIFDLFDELVHFSRVFPHERLTLEVPLIDIEEWRYPGHGRRRREIGRRRENRKGPGHVLQGPGK